MVTDQAGLPEVFFVDSGDFTLETFIEVFDALLDAGDRVVVDIGHHFDNVLGGVALSNLLVALKHDAREVLQGNSGHVAQRLDRLLREDLVGL